MVNIPLAITGAIILVVVYSDFIYTSLSTSGSGFLSKRITQLLWKCLAFLSQGPGKHLVRNYSGMVSILVLLVVWLLLTWLGNGLIFCADPDSIRVTPLPPSLTHGHTHKGDPVAGGPFARQPAVPIG